MTNTIARLAEEARQRISDRILKTPLEEVPATLLPRGVEGLWLKRECCQVSGSFKARGASHFIDRLLEEGKPAGVVTYSSGNHGRAVTEAAGARGVAAVIVAPVSIDSSKARAIEDAGGELVLVGPSSTERLEKAEALADLRGWPLIPPFDHDWIISGQGTVALEVLEELGGIDHFWVPVGGGGLSSGCAAVLREKAPECQVHAVEPQGAAPFAHSLAQGARVTLESTASEADGLLPLAIGERNWQLLRASGALSVTIDEGQLLRSLARLRGQLSIPSEPSGAAAAAPILAAMVDRPPPPGRHVAVISGGNVDEGRLERLHASVPPAG